MASFRATGSIWNDTAWWARDAPAGAGNASGFPDLRTPMRTAFPGEVAAGASSPGGHRHSLLSCAERQFPALHCPPKPISFSKPGKIVFKNPEYTPPLLRPVHNMFSKILKDGGERRTQV